ncbi:hypothetical protein A6302_03214 [Methylobrevis pamukkalensis]|uniref:Uncharacterized protein n=1 Tax=Methylobrevis pamukkalensis TaxID=1439726 RepID=A0A1E3GZI2_9HYPH|nr:hypothetical protein A6302_03214 [Methylobrevis pamukkalensis]
MTGETDDTGGALPPDSKLTRSKLRWASEQKFLTGRHARARASACRPASI